MILLKKFLNDKYFILTDQIFTSLLNFGSVFFLSKFLHESIFSNFVVLYSYALLNHTFLITVFSAPILIFAVKRWQNSSFSYLLFLLFSLSLFCLLISVIEFQFFSKQVPGIHFYGFLLMVLGLSLVDLVKRYVFTTKVVPVYFVVVGSIVMNLIFFAGMFSFRHSLDINRIFMLYWVSFLVAFLIMFVSILFSPEVRQQRFKISQITFSFGKDILFTHYHYSKWVLAGSLSFWVYSQGIYIFGDYLGVSDIVISKTRTVQNLFGLFTVIFAAMENYLTPIFAKNAMISEKIIPIETLGFYKRNYKRFILVSLLIFVAMAIVYQLIYFEKYGQAILYLLLMWLTQVISVSFKPLSIALKAKEVTYPLFYSHLFGAVVMLLLGGVLITTFGELGLLCTLFISYIVANFANLYYYKKVF